MGLIYIYIHYIYIHYIYIYNIYIYTYIHILDEFNRLNPAMFHWNDGKGIISGGSYFGWANDDIVYSKKVVIVVMMTVPSPLH